jgi:hypothetical protein
MDYTNLSLTAAVIGTISNAAIIVFITCMQHDILGGDQVSTVATILLGAWMVATSDRLAFHMFKFYEVLTNPESL